jgi:hypothetical protein
MRTEKGFDFRLDPPSGNAVYTPEEADEAMTEEVSKKAGFLRDMIREAMREGQASIGFLKPDVNTQRASLIVQAELSEQGWHARVGRHPSYPAQSFFIEWSSEPFPTVFAAVETPPASPAKKRPWWKLWGRS